MKILVGMDENATTLLYQFILVNRGHQVSITDTGGKSLSTYNHYFEKHKGSDNFCHERTTHAYSNIIEGNVAPALGRCGRGHRGLQ